MQHQDFVDRVGRREAGDRDETERHVRAVFETLAEQLDGGEWSDVREQFPTEYEALYRTVDEDREA